ncbi:DUF2380 domain-containing protein [Methylomonas sp. UP202]|uniref:DUF2380 domain-containing protein n=1 Tax=Methylomonas sp. UP202 TaxID=3040943 RepID=UPI00247973A6|nr:DUF2380 domain-containing protein [Methylomonas sp. UP202]WGS84720.1 DUF2380 domain-containing protein [Methylomonas sp. UP202]
MNSARLTIWAWLLWTAPLTAETRIAILNFELKDMTLAPGLPAEIQRTASLKPLLERELAGAGYRIVDIPDAEQRGADSGVGYLFDHADAAAQLGSRHAADYVLVGRLHKPSFLFVYLMGRLVEVKQQKIVGNYITESKGGDAKLTGKAVEALAAKIDQDLERRYSPPPPDSARRSQPDDDEFVFTPGRK